MDNDSYNKLSGISRRRISGVNTTFIRDIYPLIEWKSGMILLKGCRGVGKTYLMLQHLRLSKNKCMYLSLDNLHFLTNTLTSTIEYLYTEGYRLFALDEIHKYTNWSIELKNIYDNYPDIKLILTSSSALDILSGKGDLSRRLDEYHMKGLTFAEYLVYEGDPKLPQYTLDEMLASHSDIYEEYYEKLDLGRKFNVYLKKGYYPYFKEAGTRYHDRLIAVITQVIESDMAAIFKIYYESTRQIKKLLAMISRIVPFSPNVTKLSRDLSLSRNSVLQYLDFLAEADIISLLKSEHKSDSALTKPDKVFFENTNLLFAFDSEGSNTGTLRETFVFNALSQASFVSTPVKGDFLFDNRYVIEVGGVNKTFHQLSGMPNAILVKEGIKKGDKGILPMWMLGLLKTKADKK